MLTPRTGKYTTLSSQRFRSIRPRVRGVVGGDITNNSSAQIHPGSGFGFGVDVSGGFDIALAGGVGEMVGVNAEISYPTGQSKSVPPNWETKL